MRRAGNVLLWASILLLAGTAVYCFTWARTHREFRLGDDLHRALGVLNRVRSGEDRCYKVNGRYVTLWDLGTSGCGGIAGSLSEGRDDNFTVEVHATAERYTVRVHPAGSARLHSLYMDETGAIHFGTRDWPASKSSPLLISGR